MRAAGYECVMLGDRVEGEARAVAAEHARRALRRSRRQGRRAVILSGGELTVTIRGQGRGGPNQEYALALAIALAARPASRRSPADTDGTDGGGGSASDPAGAVIDPSTLSRAPGRSASIRPSFSPTTIPPAFSTGSATWSQPARPAPT